MTFHDITKHKEKCFYKPTHFFQDKTLYFCIKDREILSNFNFANLNHIYELFSEMTSFIWSPKLLFSLRFILYKIFESDARNNWMDSHIEFINDAILARTAYKLTYANECILNIWHKNKVYLPLILNVGDWRMEKGMKSGCQWASIIILWHCSVSILTSVRIKVI